MYSLDTNIAPHTAYIMLDPVDLLICIDLPCSPHPCCGLIASRIPRARPGRRCAHALVSLFFFSFSPFPLAGARQLGNISRKDPRPWRVAFLEAELRLRWEACLMYVRAWGVGCALGYFCVVRFFWGDDFRGKGRERGDWGCGEMVFPKTRLFCCSR